MEAAAAAAAKRQGKAKQSNVPDRSNLAMQIKAEKERAGKKKEKKHGATPIY